MPSSKLLSCFVISDGLGQHPENLIDLNTVIIILVAVSVSSIFLCICLTLLMLFDTF